MLTEPRGLAWNTGTPARVAYAVRCELCFREVLQLTVHHLTPKDEGGTDGPVAELCSACHRQIHVLFDNKTLARELDTLPKLRSEPRLVRFLHWVRKQDPGRRITVRRRRR